MVHLGVDLLRLERREEFHQLDAIVPVRRVFRQHDAGDVDMCTASLRVGEQHLDRLGPFLLNRLLFIGLHLGHVIGVADGDIAGAGINPLYLRAVVTGRFLAEISLETFEPFQRLCFAIMGDHGCDQRDIIGMLARADADFAFPFRISKFFICDGVLGNPCPGRINHARAPGQAEPVAFRVAIGGGNVLVQGGRTDGL